VTTSRRAKLGEQGKQEVERGQGWQIHLNQPTPYTADFASCIPTAWIPAGSLSHFPGPSSTPYSVHWEQAVTLSKTCCQLRHNRELKLVTPQVHASLECVLDNTGDTLRLPEHPLKETEVWDMGQVFKSAHGKTRALLVSFMLWVLAHSHLNFILYLY
jgi:hypothetical protein